MLKGHNLGFVLITGLAVLALSSFMSRNRAIPDLGELNQVTEFPADIKNVLSWPAPTSLNVPILMYHYVEYVADKRDTIRQSLNIYPSTLTAQIETLKKAGYAFITPDDLSLAMRGVVDLPPKPVVLSFDDGYRDFYTDVFPILKKEYVKAVAYIVPNFLDHPNYMYTSEVKEVAASALVEIGAHTMDHMWLKGAPAKKADYEITESRNFLRKLTGQQINSFAYPYGAFDKEAMALVEKAGFLNAVSTLPGNTQSKENEYFLYRLRPGSRTGEALISYISQTKFASAY